MKILVIGFLAFLTWSAVSTYVYVCKIKGLCCEQATVQVDSVSQNGVSAGETLGKPQVAPPKDLTIYFATNKSESNSNAALDGYIDASKVYLEQNAQAKVFITGHADAIGSDEYNQTLGFRRAQVVQRYFESKGMLADKIVVESKGEKETADDNSTEAGRTNNRRTVITIKN